MKEISRFIEEMNQTENPVKFELSLTLEGNWRASIRDSSGDIFDILDRRGEMILNVVREEPDEAIEALEALCSVEEES